MRLQARQLSPQPSRTGLPTVLCKCDPHPGGPAALSFPRIPLLPAIPLHSCSPPPRFPSGESAPWAGKGDIPPGGFEVGLVGCPDKSQGNGKNMAELNFCSGEAAGSEGSRYLLGSPPHSTATRGNSPDCTHSSSEAHLHVCFS